jgi:hypothetical protein
LNQELFKFANSKTGFASFAAPSGSVSLTGLQSKNNRFFLKAQHSVGYIRSRQKAVLNARNRILSMRIEKELQACRSMRKAKTDCCPFRTRRYDHRR